MEEIKFQTSNICDALLRNINNNFLSVSFNISIGKAIDVKIILEKKTEVEDGYIEDFFAELSAAQQSDRTIEVRVEVGGDFLPLEYLVYSKSRK